MSQFRIVIPGITRGILDFALRSNDRRREIRCFRITTQSRERGKGEGERDAGTVRTKQRASFVKQ